MAAGIASGGAVIVGGGGVIVPEVPDFPCVEETTACLDCENDVAPYQYSVTFAGITDGDPFAGGCTDCDENGNGTFILTFSGDPSNCNWSVAYPICQPGGRTLNLVRVGNTWLLQILSGAIAEVQWNDLVPYDDCLQPFTLPKSFESQSACNNYPATVTISPV